MSQPLQRLSDATLNLSYHLHTIGIRLIETLPILGAIVATLFVRRQTLRHEPHVWSALRIPLFISMTFLGLIFWYQATTLFFSMGEINYLKALLKSTFFLFLSATLYGICLHYKKLFAWHRIQTFIIGFFIGFAIFVITIIIFRMASEFLLQRDPAYQPLLDRLAELKLQRASQ